PIIVGGSAKPRSVRAAVRYADEYNTPFPTLEDARARRAAVDRAAAEAGRERLRFSMMLSCVVGRDRADADERLRAWRAVSGADDSPLLSGTIDEVAERLRAYESAGVERAMLQHTVHEDVEMVAVLGELARQVG